MPLRPDIALEVANGPNAGLHLLDAKFKVDALDKILSADETEDEGADEIAQERRGTFKRGDLYKMHTYRDATPRARSVWIVYPGTDMRFFSRSGVTAAPYALPATLEGVGALPLQPLTDAQFPLKELLLRLLSN